jgi:aspartate aminotransferase
MTASAVSERMRKAVSVTAPLVRFMNESSWARRRQGNADLSDFTFGDPQEMPIPGYVEALQRVLTPRDKDWYAYKENEPEARAVVAAALRSRRNLRFEDEDIFLTTGAFAAIAVALATIVDPGDEVIMNDPPWFFYEAMTLAAGGVPVHVGIEPHTFDLDLRAIEAAITPRTRAIFVNSPNNPTGRIYQPALLKDLAAILKKASRRNGRTIYLLSDEAYSRILYDGQSFYSPTEYYANSFLLYTYGKTLLAPGERMGYLALPPGIENRRELREAIYMAQITTGYGFPNALLQHALPDLEKLSVDLAHLQRKRDRMVAELREMGYDVHTPEGTFYLLPKSPIADDWAFVELLGEHNISCLPGATIGCPGYFRISLTANDDMITRALPGFAAAREVALRQVPVTVVAG